MRARQADVGRGWPPTTARAGDRSRAAAYSAVVPAPVDPAPTDPGMPPGLHRWRCRRSAAPRRPRSCAASAPCASTGCIAPARRGRCCFASTRRSVDRALAPLGVFALMHRPARLARPAAALGPPAARACGSWPVRRAAGPASGRPSSRTLLLCLVVPARCWDLATSAASTTSRRARCIVRRLSAATAQRRPTSDPPSAATPTAGVLCTMRVTCPRIALRSTRARLVGSMPLGIGRLHAAERLQALLTTEVSSLVSTGLHPGQLAGELLDRHLALAVADDPEVHRHAGQRRGRPSCSPA